MQSLNFEFIYFEILFEKHLHVRDNLSNGIMMGFD